jgi:hypothetical protein
MNDGALNQFKYRRELLGYLQTADDNLRAGLHRHGLEALVRAHLDRALAHIREAYIAVNEETKIRSLQELTDQLTRLEQMQAGLRTKQKHTDESQPSIQV